MRCFYDGVSVTLQVAVAKVVAEYNHEIRWLICIPATYETEEDARNGDCSLFHRSRDLGSAGFMVWGCKSLLCPWTPSNEVHLDECVFVGGLRLQRLSVAGITECLMVPASAIKKFLDVEFTGSAGTQLRKPLLDPKGHRVGLLAWSIWMMVSWFVFCHFQSVVFYHLPLIA